MMIFMAGLIFVSCYDKDNTIHRIPDLVIENVTGGSVKTGEVIEITPKCVMGGEEVECTYNWYRYRDTVLELISEFGMAGRYCRLRYIRSRSNSC